MNNEKTLPKVWEKVDKCYSPENKPTPDDIGALRKSDPASAISDGKIKLQYQNGNELNFYQNSDRVWFGYRGNSITTYLFGDGGGHTTSTIEAGNISINSLTISSGDFKYNLPVTTGGHARGIHYYASNDSNNRLGGIGEFGGNGNSIEKFSLGFGSNWWSLDLGGLVVFPTELRHGIMGKWRVYSEGYKPTTFSTYNEVKTFNISPEELYNIEFQNYLKVKADYEDFGFITEDEFNEVKEYMKSIHPSKSIALLSSIQRPNVMSIYDNKIKDNV